MSARHPIIAITGSSGSGTSTIRVAFEHIFRRHGIHAVFVDGDSFHAYNRDAMREAEHQAMVRGENFSHYGPAANLLDRLERLFQQYGATGSGIYRHYVHKADESDQHGVPAGQFSPWRPLPTPSDFLVYEGLHGGVVTDRYHIAEHVDLLLGVTPTINLEWIQKIQRDTRDRGYHKANVTESIIRRMPDYVHYMIPQFSRTDINFQRVPLVDTSNPFIARDIPLDGETMLVIRFRNPREKKVDFPYLLSMIDGSIMSRPNTIVVSGGKMRFAMELILTPWIESLLERKRSVAATEKH